MLFVCVCACVKREGLYVFGLCTSQWINRLGMAKPNVKQISLGVFFQTETIQGGQAGQIHAHTHLHTQACRQMKVSGIHPCRCTHLLKLSELQITIILLSESTHPLLLCISFSHFSYLSIEHTTQTSTWFAPVL